MVVLTAYLFQGFSLSTNPETMSWKEFSENTQAMEHYAERNGIEWDGSAAQTEELRKQFEQNVGGDREGVSPHDGGSVVPSLSWTSRVQRVMHSLYHFWQPRRDPAGRHVHHVFRFSPALQLRWNISMTLVLLLALAAVCTAGVSSLERKAKA
jgi:hypothetical protein